MTRTPVPGGSTQHAPPPALPAPRAPELDADADAEAAAAQTAPDVAGGSAAPGVAMASGVPTAPAVPATPGVAENPAAGPVTGQTASQTAAARRADDAAGPFGTTTLAAPWRRLAAFAIDALILTLATGALWGRLLASFANRMGNAASAQAARAPGAHGAYGRVWAHTLGTYLIVLVPTIIMAIVYYWLLTGYWGTTFGKRALGCWVTESDGRSRVSLRRAFLRALVFVAGGELVPPFFIADNVWLTADARRRALHDKAAHTVVVRHPPAR